MNIATRTSSRFCRETFPIDNPKRIEIALTFTDNQFAKLLEGLIPRQMEDKWFIFYENDALYFHRSWTGFGIYQAPLIKERDGYSIKEFWVEKNQEKWQNEDDNTDIETISFLIARGLLGIEVREIYANQHIPAGTDSMTGLKGWSNVGSLLFTNPGVDYTDKIKSVLFGVAVGDALGVPVEFKNRPTIRKNPVTDMIGYNLPPGTFSDDSSLTFCLAEALTKEFDLNTIGENFVKWYYHNYWTPRGKVFDIGITTRRAIDRLAKGKRPDLAGDVEVSSNGNGSLMRISPLLFYLLDKPIEERFEITKQVSSMTHGHIRSVIACFYYLEFARQLFAERDKFEIYKNLQTEVTKHLTSLSINPTEVALFDRLLKGNIHELTEENIFSGGYVLHTLEASIWCLLTSDNYKDAVLKAVNLGGDTDTTGAVTGGLAGLLYGFDNIPTNWINQIARRDDIEELAERLGGKLLAANRR